MISVKNVYYMLAYAYELLDYNGYKELASEEFDNISDLFSLILCNSVNVLIKKGINKCYTETNDLISTVKGKININECINKKSSVNRKVYCEFDELTANNMMNQIIKTTINYLLNSNASKTNKKKLRKLLIYFHNIDSIDTKDIIWRFKFYRHITNYKSILAVCYFVLNGLVQTTVDGKKKIANFINDENMNKLYERFLLRFFQRECKDVITTSSKIDWQLDSEYDFRLPNMQSDVMITKDSKILIIDAKYYSNIFNKHFNKEIVRSNNLYQIFTYVKNKQIEDPNKEVSGMLLYAKTDELDDVNECYNMSGNKISVLTLDLNQDFNSIKENLFKIKREYFK